MRINSIIVSNLVYIRISLLEFVGNVHPYKMWYLFSLCICSGLFVSSYTVGKMSLFLYIMYMIDNNMLVLLILLLFVLYPLCFIVLLHPIVVSNIYSNIVVKSVSSGICVHNMYVLFMALFTLLNLFVFVMLLLVPLYSFVLTLLLCIL
jgi:hypothetical protein